MKYADVKSPNLSSLTVLLKTCLQNVPGTFCVFPVRNCNSIALLALAVGAYGLAFLTLSCKNWTEVIKNVVLGVLH